VSLGNFLIKRVVTYLKNEFPSLKNFVTLSPIPGFMDWVINGAPLGEAYDDPAVLNKVSQYLEKIDLKKQSWPERLSNGWHPDKATDEEKDALIGLCAIYLAKFSVRKGGNPVAKFHLGNGAQLYRINWAGDLSKKGLRQSASLMVNYLYDLDKIEDNHERFVNGEVIYSRLVTKIL
jgi:malonyl-CoA decarboxylase